MLLRHRGDGEILAKPFNRSVPVNIDARSPPLAARLAGDSLFIASARNACCRPTAMVPTVLSACAIFSLLSPTIATEDAAAPTSRP